MAALPAAAQAGGDQSGITRQQADEILKELRQIRQLLEKQQAQPAAQPQTEQPTRAKITDLTGVSMLGSKAAPLTIVEYTDYQCPFCQRFHVTAFAELKKNYIDTGKVRFYSKDLPLDFHPNAMRAAQAARCAAEQGKFWELRDIMGANPDKLDMEHIVGFAADLKMDSVALRGCVDSGKYKEPGTARRAGSDEGGGQRHADVRGRQERRRRRGRRTDGGRDAVRDVRREAEGTGEVER